MAEFKIGRLRYTWRGQWATQTFYNRDAVVEFNGKTYIALEPHDSGDFYDDLVQTNEQGAVTPYWEMMLDGRAWKQEWTPVTYYSLGNIVTYGGVVYTCTEHHTSGASVIDLTKWATYASYDNWNNSWEVSFAYGLGDLVKYGGIVYRCITNHVSADNLSDGLEFDQNKWEVVNAGVEYKNTWTQTTRYKVNDLVKNGTDIYACTEGHTSGSTIDPAKWQLWLPGLEYANTWNSGTLYQPGDIVIYGGYTYECNIINNVNNIPSTDALGWTLVTKGYNLRQDWNSGAQYKVGDVVRRNGQLYSATADNSNQDPTLVSLSTTYTAAGSSGTTLKVASTTGVLPGMIVLGVGFRRGQTVVSVEDTFTVILNEAPGIEVTDSQSIAFTGVNYVYWQLVVPSVYWTDFWAQGTTYYIGDLVVWGSGTYRCIQNHTTSDSSGGGGIGGGTGVDNNIVSSRPDNDVLNAYWIPEALHNRRNAMTSQGDLLTVNADKTSPVHIGTQDFVLRATNDIPAWRKILAVQKVYYVAADTGVDDADHGTTLDRPWKTIKYACEQALKGTENQNANYLLTANKAWLVEEMYQWMLYQVDQEIAPFAAGSLFDETATKRDAGLIIDAISYDISRGGNSQTVAATIRYFADGSNTTFFNDATDAAQAYIVAALTYLGTLMTNVFQQLPPDVNYQVLNNVATPIDQFVDAMYVAEPSVTSLVDSLMVIPLVAIANANTNTVPQPYQSISTTIFVKTGTYSEDLPIVVPENTAVVGDELRGVVVQPSVGVFTTSLRTYTTGNIFRLDSSAGLELDMPIQFAIPQADRIAGIEPVRSDIVFGQTYYVASINGNDITVSETIGGTDVVLTNSITDMEVMAGNCLGDMFRMRNGSGLRNMSLTGLMGTVSTQNVNLTRRPTGGTFVALDPGTGPTDTTVWILKRSPYVQNVTTFGQGCTGFKIDGTLHDGGNKSMVANDFTQIISDGIGVWCTGSGSLTECVSVFSYYCYAGYFAESGGRIRATNGNSSYGTYGVIAEGYDSSETPINGNIDNQSTQVQATVQSAFGVSAELLKMQFANAGSSYNTLTTNMLEQSNHFDTATWTSDGNVTIQQNVISPSGYADGWTLTGNTSTTDSSYIYQSIPVSPAGKLYTAMSGTNITGLGSSATFDVRVGSTGYLVSVNTGGSNYVVGNEINILGSQLGGVDGVNDCVITVQSLTGNAIATVSSAGVVPEGSAMLYTFSVHAKKGSATSFDVYATFSGSSTVSSTINYNFLTGQFTPGNVSGGVVPTLYDKLELPNGWYRLWFSFYDSDALNTTLQIRLYPRGRSAPVGSTAIYGTQLQIGGEPTFYLETESDAYSAYANYKIVGAGINARAVGDELRTNAIHQVRVTDQGSGVGGASYLTSSNSSQGGTSSYIIVAGSDTKAAHNYVGMRLFINSGTGAGQYGFISDFNDVNKRAQILKESFETLEITTTSSGTDRFTLGGSLTTDTMYIDQPVQFIPTYYSTTVTETATDETITVTETTGGIVNQMYVSSTAKLTVNMPIRFFGTTFGGVTDTYTYYVKEIIDDNRILISTELFGNTWLLTSATGTMTMSIPGRNDYVIADTTNMQVNMPIQFTGTSIGSIIIGDTYYICDVIDSGKFTIATTLKTGTASATNVSTGNVTLDTTSGFATLNPIVFSGTSFGGLVSDQKYYIKEVVDGFNIKLTDSLRQLTATETVSSTGLITVNSTAGLVLNDPIIFSGNTFGGLANGTTYYILAVASGTEITVSSSKGGSAVVVTNATGEMYARTPNGSSTISTASGTMNVSTTNAREAVSIGYGALNATFRTELFGNVIQGETYFVKTLGSNYFTVSDTLGGGTFTLAGFTGSMNVGAVGWDHINPGTPIEPTLDSSSVYYIEAKTKFSTPQFSQTASTTPNLAPGSQWVALGYGDNAWVAVPSGNSTGAVSTDGTTWSPYSLPRSAEWSDVEYGNGHWVMISKNGIITESGSAVAVSKSNGLGWRINFLPSKKLWTNVVYGNGRFVAIGETSAAVSTNYGSSWSETTINTDTWVGLVFGNGMFVAVSPTNSKVAYSANGSTWTVVSLPATATWSDVTFGNGVFVAVSSTSAKSAYSVDGINWYSSNLSIAATKVAYGQGVFVAVNSANGTAYTTDNGMDWIIRSVTNDGYGAIAFGYDSTSNYVGRFVTVAGQNISSTISAGARTMGRPVISSGKITSISLWEPGSGYTSMPTLTFTDPNVTKLVTTQLRKTNGALGNPTFVNRGEGYNTTSTAITISGGGFADSYQVGLSITVKNLTSLPRPGDNLVIEGNSKVYKVTNATAIFGTVAPNIKANIQISPDMTTALSPDNDAQVTIRQKYSQCRLTGHDFLNVGYGNYLESNYPGLPTDTVLAPQDQAVEVDYGRVFYTSTDQDGNFRVGNLFAVEQATGIVTLSASQFGLTGLETLSLGGIAVGGSSVVVRQFSTDSSFIANSNTIIPTQRAIKEYLQSRLSQGGSNTFTGQLIAGTVLLGGPDRIGSTIPEGVLGSSVEMPNVVNVHGEFAGWDGDGMAFNFFMNNASKRNSGFGR